MQDEQNNKAESLAEITALRERVQNLEQEKNALRESEQRWRSLVESLSDIVMIVDPEGTLLFINHTVPDITQEQAIGKSVYDYIPDEHHHIMRESLERVFRTGENDSNELAGVGPYGKTSWYRSRVGPIKQHGKIVAVSFVSTDVTERKRAETALRSQEDLLRNIVSNVPYSIFWKDRNSVYLGCNDNFAKWAGIKNPADIIGRTDYDLPWKKEESDWYRKIDQEVIAKGSRILNIEESVHDTRGKSAIILTSKVPLKNVEGEIIGILGIYTDITERKKAEKALKESEQRFRAIFNSAADGIVLVDAQDKHFDTANETFCQMLGYSTEEVESLAVADIHPEPDLPHVIDVFEKQVRREIKLAKDIPVKRSDGSIFYADINSIPITLTGNKYLMGIFRDITDRKRIEDALRESEDKYRDLVEEMTDVIYALDTEGKVTSINKAGKAAFGREAAEVIGTSFTNWIPQEYRRDATAVFKRILSGEKVTAETVLLDKDGKPHNVEFSSTPMIKHGTVVGTRGIIRDVTWRKQAEQKLRESEEKYRQLVSTTTDAIMLFDADTRRFIEVNKACEELYGYTREEFLNLRQSDISAEPQESEASIKKTLQGKLGKIPLRYHRKKDGTIFPVEISASTFEIAGRKVLCGVVRDITERKKAEEEIKKFKTISDRAGYGAAISDPQGYLIYVNDSFAKMHGYEPAELMGKNLSIFHNEEQIATFRKLNEQLLQGDNYYIGQEVWHKRKDNTVFPALMNGILIKDEGGKALFIAATAIDITKRKRVEQALADSEQQYRTLVESTGETIVTLDKNGVILFMNSTGTKGLGGKPQDYIGKTPRDIFTKEIADHVISNVQKVIQTEKLLNEISLVEIQGQLRWHNITIEPLRSTGKVNSVMVIARDIHEQKQAEEELRRYREEMAQTERLASLGTLSATLAHELTQPLTVVRLSIQNSLAESNVDSYSETVRENLEEALAGISSASTIIDRFRNFARKSTERTISKINLAAVSNKIVQLLNESAQQAKVSIYMKDIDGLPVIYSCERELEQLFFALIENAIEVADGEKKREITISATLKGSHIELQFSDNCGGIAPEHLDKIFEPFFTTNAIGQGTGLGLCIVQRIVSEHGGHIRVENEYGKGCTFFVTLPIRQER